MSTSPSFSAFFYGTLLHPKVIKRVIGNDGNHLQICPAVLLDHTRHRVKHEAYPGLLPYSKSMSLFKRDLSIEERSVPGNLVTGLTKADMLYLDLFEGSEYALESIVVHPLGLMEALNDPSDSVVTTTPHNLPESLPDGIEAVTYMWSAPKSNLEQELWPYEVFIRDSVGKWVGPSASREGYDEVDKRREADGVIEKVAENAINEGALN